jgi:hypothetical protein
MAYNGHLPLGDHLLMKRSDFGEPSGQPNRLEIACRFWAQQALPVEGPSATQATALVCVVNALPTAADQPHEPA